MLPEFGVFAGQVGEVRRLVLVAVAGVHRLVEGHGGRLTGGAPLPLPPPPSSSPPRRHSAVRSPKRLLNVPRGQPGRTKAGPRGGEKHWEGRSAAVREEQAAAILRGWVKERGGMFKVWGSLLGMEMFSQKL